jgi:hypothetical protein
MRLVLVTMGLLIAPVIAQTITLANTSNGALGMDFVVGDAFATTITAAAPNQTVSVASTQNGQTLPLFNVGTTDANGSFTLTGTEAGRQYWRLD